MENMNSSVKTGDESYCAAGNAGHFVGRTHENTFEPQYGIVDRAAFLVAGCTFLFLRMYHCGMRLLHVDNDDRENARCGF